jgi:hypothetical protein
MEIATLRVDNVQSNLLGWSGVPGCARVCAGPQLTLPVDSIFTFVYSFSTNGTYDNLNEPK